MADTSYYVHITLAVLCWVLTQGIFVPCEGYWLYKFWVNRQSSIIRKRKPKLLVIKIISHWLFHFLFLVVLTLIAEHKAFLYFWFIISPLLWTNIMMHCIRYWLIFYAIRYCAAMKHNKWQSVINPESSTTNWYLKNKKTWGSYDYIKKYCTLYGVLSCMISTYTLLIPHGVAAVDYVFLSIGIVTGWIAPIILFTSIVCKLPAYNDNIGIRKELKFTVIGYMLLMVLLVVSLTSSIIINEFISGNSETIFYIWYIVLRMVTFVVTLKHIRFPMVKYGDIVFNRVMSSDALAITHQATLSKFDQKDLEKVRLTESQNMDGADPALVLRTEMRAALKDNDLFVAFMEHLFSEYCAECLLSMVEFTQFKEKIVAENKDNDSIEFKEEDIKRAIVLPNNAGFPDSSIVYGDTSHYQQIAKGLYDKYIRVGSELEINIDYGNRNRYKDLFENEDKLNGMDIKELYDLFDPCIDHMFQLIVPAFTRFKNREQYRLIHSYAPPKKVSNR